MILSMHQYQCCPQYHQSMIALAEILETLPLRSWHHLQSFSHSYHWYLSWCHRLLDWYYQSKQHPWYICQTLYSLIEFQHKFTLYSRNLDSLETSLPQTSQSHLY